MEKAIKYADCMIVVRTTEHARLGFGWEFSIDGKPQGSSEEFVAPSSERAVEEALSVAMLQIDCWREPHTAWGG